MNLDQALYASAPYEPNPEGGPDLAVQDCGFHNNGAHLQIQPISPMSNAISANEFSGTGVVQLLFDSLYSLDVRYNWWGQSSGPLPGQVVNDTAAAELLTTPFLTSDPLASFP